MKKNNEARLFGAHMPIGGGVENAPLSGKKTGCAVMQIFTKNSNQWKAKNLEPSSVEKYLKNLGESGIKAVASHDSYLINLGSPNPVLREKSLAAFIDEIERAALLKIPFLVFHPGSHLGSGEEAGLDAVAECMNKAISATKKHPDVMLVIETTAGQGTNLGYKFEHIARLIDGVKDQGRVGVCLDTCHVFAAGYDIRTEAGYKKTFAEFDRIIGLDKLVFFHVNDSKKDFGSRVDRHEHIGKGFIGEKAFELLVNDKRFFKIPMALETPKEADLKEDVENLATLRRLAGIS
ncbi:MAG: deoxyribonuclease IV [Nitrospinae bacterium]|nr:deoxyribonuclease IV [Nitrospinota bacterium]